MNSVIADTTIEANEFLKTEEHNIDYPIYYIGPQLDTIKIGRQYLPERTEWVNDFKNLWCKNYSDSTLLITVDTVAKTNSPDEYFSENPTVARDSTINYHSFLFSITNISDSILYLGRTFSVFYICREAKDEKGNWIRIDKTASEQAFCLTGSPVITLHPNEILISKIRRYKGSFVTDFRLKFGLYDNVVYSNTFRDSIDLHTFQNLTTDDE